MNMKGASQARSQGFTIVELLIVIVVIGILAAIVIIAYNGVTMKARQSAMVSAVGSYASIINAYSATNGVLPSPGGEYGCLGTPPGGGGCGSTTGPNACGYGAVDTDSTLNTKLQTVVASLPTTPQDTYQCSSAAGRGIIYDYASATNVLMYFWVNGTTCPVISGTAPMATHTENGNSACSVKLNGSS